MANQVLSQARALELLIQKVDNLSVQVAELRARVESADLVGVRAMLGQLPTRVANTVLAVQKST